eukprot:s102_g34.t1
MQQELRLRTHRALSCRIWQEFGDGVARSLDTYRQIFGHCLKSGDGNVGDRSFGQGIGLGLGPPISQRERVTDTPCVGTVVEWKGTYGWLESALPIDHPLSSARGGKIFVHHRDLPRGVESLLEGQPLSFHVYSDATGLGAEEVVIA